MTNTPSVIVLNRGLSTIVSQEDFEWANQWTWHASTPAVYAYRKTCRSYKQKGLFLHREILARKLGRPLLASEQTDHKDGNKLNNTRDNLRVCTHKENQRNRPGRIHSSRFKGVSLTPELKRKKWKAMIRTDYLTTHLGYFENEEEAARVYDSAAVFFHGEFARLNFPHETPAPYTPKKLKRKENGYSSQFFGVSWNKLRGKWTSSISDNNKNVFLGFFTDEVEAARAYDQKAIALRGGRARLNFPTKEKLDAL